LRLPLIRRLGMTWHDPLFDAAWYVQRYPDVAISGIDPERHYRLHGAGEGRDPNPLFDTSWYLRRNPDVASSGMNPLDHYFLFGGSERRDPGPAFASGPYLDAHPDVREAGINPLLDYLRRGPDEGRLAAPEHQGRTERAASGPISGSLPFARFLLVGHDALNMGAQQLALHLAKTLSRDYHVQLDIVLLGEGELWSEFERYGRVHDLARRVTDRRDQEALLRRLHDSGLETAICNTTASGRLVPMLGSIGYRVVCLVHELSGLIRDYDLEPSARNIALQAEAIVFPNARVLGEFEGIVGPLGSRSHVRSQGLFRATYPGDPADVRQEVRREQGLDAESQLVLAVGWADVRKGFDLFQQVFTTVRRIDPRAAFMWIGCEDESLAHWYERDAQQLGYQSSLRLLPRVADLPRYYAAADVLLLPSREDPFPSVVLEALSHGTPVVAFEGTTGAEELLKRGGGVLVPYLDIPAMSRGVTELLGDPSSRAAKGIAGRRIVEREYDWLGYVDFLLGLAGRPDRRVSVIVPNFNYARYLEQRLQSIFKQRIPVFEVIVLDDASTDESVAVVEGLRDANGWPLSVVRNAENSGSVFWQWKKGLELTRGDLIWIAEADDIAEPEFLSKVLPAFDDRRVVLAYSESRQIDADGRVLADDYLSYVDDIAPGKWTTSWRRDGLDEVADTLAIRNTIPNVSAVVFRRQALADTLARYTDEITGFRVAGDYDAYVRLLLSGGRIAFIADVLNNHRRHEQGVTLGSFDRSLIDEIAAVQAIVRRETDVTPGTAHKAAAYLRSLELQFGLPSSATHGT
jgi:glycosyltransferase involved in cell wall biosynthesis